MGLSASHLELLTILESRRDTIDGEREQLYGPDYLERHVPACPARDVIALMMRRFPLTHARIHFGPPLDNGLGPEHELIVMNPVMIDACAHDLRPGGYVIGAGYVAFASDGDCKDQHFIGPHPATSELTIVQIFRHAVREHVTSLSPDQCHVHAPTLLDFFRECQFVPQADAGHPPRK